MQLEGELCGACLFLQICEAFAANRYPFPEDPARQRQMHSEVTARLRELHTTIDAGQRHRESVLQNIAFNLDQWATQVRRVVLRGSPVCLLCCCWCVCPMGSG
jgi:hypothetical protein